MQTSVDKFLRRNKRINNADNYQDMTSLFRVLDMDEYDTIYGIDFSDFKMHHEMKSIKYGAYRKMSGATLNIIYECPCKTTKKIHHHYNYDRPLEVMLLCHSCHGKEHSRLSKQSDQSDNNTLASHEQPNSRDLMVREDRSFDMVSSYAESVPCTGDDTQTDSMTAV